MFSVQARAEADKLRGRLMAAQAQADSRARAAAGVFMHVCVCVFASLSHSLCACVAHVALCFPCARSLARCRTFILPKKKTCTRHDAIARGRGGVGECVTHDLKRHPFVLLIWRSEVLLSPEHLKRHLFDLLISSETPLR